MASRMRPIFRPAHMAGSAVTALWRLEESSAINVAVNQRRQASFVILIVFLLWSVEG